MRLLFLILLLANVAAFGYIRFAESRAGADAQNTPLQISPEKMKLLKPGRGAQITASGASDVKSVTATSTAFIGAWKCDYYSGYEIAYFPDSTFVLHVIQPHQNFFLFGHFKVQGSRLYQMGTAIKLLAPGIVARGWTIADKSDNVVESSYSTTELTIISVSGSQQVLQHIRIVNWDGVDTLDLSDEKPFTCIALGGGSSQLTQERASVPAELR